jgi:exosortase
MRLPEYVEKPLFQMVTLGILVIILYYSVIRDLVGDWIIDENYSHGFLIPLVSVFFIWRQRANLRAVHRKPHGLGLVIFLAGLLMFMAANVAAEHFTMRFSLLVVMSGLILYLGGKDIAGKLWFPLVYLVFMIPVPYVLYYSASFPLELLASRWTTTVVSLLGIPIFREGNILHLQNITLQVIDACSGLRSLISLSALSAAMAYVTQKTVLKGVILFLTSVPVAIMANILRLSVTAVLASLYGEQLAQGFLHKFSGILVFAFAVISLYLIGRLLIWLSFKKNIGLFSACY